MCVFQFFGLVGSGQGINDLVDIAVHNLVDLIKGQADPVVGDTALGEIIGADALIAHTGAHLAAAHTGNFRFKPFLLDLIELGGQHPHTLFPVLLLAALFLAGYHNTGGLVDQANSGAGFVNMLAAGTGCPVDLHFNIGGVDLHIHRLHLRQYRHGGRRCVDSAAGLCLRHTLDAMDAGLILQS